MSDAPVMLVDVKSKPKCLPPRLKRLAGAAINKLTDRLCPEIPLGAMFDALKALDIVAVDEDGTPWSGFLCGKAEAGTEAAKNQRCSIRLAFTSDNHAARMLSGDTMVEQKFTLAREGLQISWCRIGEKLEVVSYIL